MNQLERFLEVAKDCEQRYGRSRTPYTNLYWRSPAEIKESGDIHYLCCTERNLIVAQHALEAGLENMLVMMRIKRLIQPAKFGVGLELDLDGEGYMFVSGNSGVVLKPGHYSEKRKLAKEITHVRSAVTTLNDSMNFFDHLGIHSVADLEQAIPGLDFNNLMRKTRKKSTPENYKAQQLKLASLQGKQSDGRIYVPVTSRFSS